MFPGCVSECVFAGWSMSGIPLQQTIWELKTRWVETHQGCGPHQSYAGVWERISGASASLRHACIHCCWGKWRCFAGRWKHCSHLPTKKCFEKFKVLIKMLFSLCCKEKLFDSWPDPLIECHHLNIRLIHFSWPGEEESDDQDDW